MAGYATISTNEAPMFVETKYSIWSMKMKWNLQSVGYDIWNSNVNGYVPPNKVKSTTQKEARRYNSKAKEIILDGLPDPVKERVGKCISAKELWDKLKDLYPDEEALKEQEQNDSFTKDVVQGSGNHEEEENLHDQKDEYEERN